MYTFFLLWGLWLSAHTLVAPHPDLLFFSTPDPFHHNLVFPLSLDFLALVLGSEKIFDNNMEISNARPC